ncbi:hypothetical protein ESA_00909 [Cronobacter sakazakii ATCC BAA-894]|uniref:Uncharacterized protein n=1 Tax=Cronobacter sakazakii (strain ATCC BAA-894) TaxID=290339 RepID=A7MH45_CROS8|nr:hypothetical protein ESA_00909 [Cronobacter sakazakii ATCC BAA-894]
MVTYPVLSVRTAHRRPAGRRANACGLIAVDVKIEILFGKLLVGAVGAHVGKRLVQRLAQFVIFFTDPHPGADAKEFFIFNRRAAELIAFAHRLLQKAFTGGHFILKRGVDTARGQIGIDIVLALIRDNFHAFRRPVLITVGFLSGALQHAHAFALQRLQRRLDGRAFCHHQARIRSVELVGKGDFLLAFFGDRQRRHNRVDFLRFQRRDQRIQRLFSERTLRLNAFAQFFGQIDVETNQFTLRVFRFKRRIGRVSADT